MELEIVGKMIAVWFSCGAASAVAGKRTIDRYGAHNTVLLINHPVLEEDLDNRRFLKDVSEWLGCEIIEYSNKEFESTSAEDVWRKRRYMSGRKGAPCTVVLKKSARYAFESEVKIDYHVLGFTADEQARHDRFIKGERENVLPVLIEAGITKEMCFEIIKDAGIELPLMYRLGYANANCIGCVKATSPTYWNHVRRVHPEVFEERAKLSREIGCRLVRYKGKRIFLDELPADAKGRKMKGYDCGIFCDTN